VAEGQGPASTQLMTPEQVSKHLQIDTERLSKMRIEGTGPAFVKHGRLVRYRPAALVAWIECHEVTSTRGAGRA